MFSSAVAAGPPSGFGRGNVSLPYPLSTLLSSHDTQSIARSLTFTVLPHIQFIQSQLHSTAYFPLGQIPFHRLGAASLPGCSTQASAYFPPLRPFHFRRRPRRDFRPSAVRSAMSDVHARLRRLLLMLNPRRRLVLGPILTDVRHDLGSPLFAAQLPNNRWHANARVSVVRTCSPEHTHDARPGLGRGGPDATGSKRCGENPRTACREGLVPGSNGALSVRDIGACCRARCVTCAPTSV
ncbi:hypothetical protein EXIGLDRAFT_278587 [Exidia glandulosa HHB12029]|uniref:Uncharacterized protein n=1 Tax=Exidia glandulosa HHB12029 TaxID=1314781 RepID=A0A165DJP7_EXIGL|nr:hypothetical protein EXIGLDRAFT_278587 [Exidia glandulosa HHB12029]